MGLERDPNCPACQYFKDHNQWSEWLDKICNGCGHPFGDHHSPHPHWCGGPDMHDCECEVFSTGVIYGPFLPTAEEMYEALSRG